MFGVCEEDAGRIKVLQAQLSAGCNSVNLLIILLQQTFYTSDMINDF